MFFVAVYIYASPPSHMPQSMPSMPNALGRRVQESRSFGRAALTLRLDDESDHIMLTHLLLSSTQWSSSRRPGPLEKYTCTNANFCIAHDSTVVESSSLIVLVELTTSRASLTSRASCDHWHRVRSTPARHYTEFRSRSLDTSSITARRLLYLAEKSLQGDDILTTLLEARRPGTMDGDRLVLK